VKTVFPDATNLSCQFHIDKNVKAKCKTLDAQKNAWGYVMEAWGSFVHCPCESSFDEYLKNFEMACSPWPMFVDYVCQTWVIPHKEKFVKAWTNKVMHLGNTTTNRYQYCFLFVLICLSVDLNENVVIVYMMLYISFVGLRVLIGH